MSNRKCENTLRWNMQDENGEPTMYSANALYRNMVFAELWDTENLSPKERMVAIMIYRQTVHYKKRWDSISISRIGAVIGVKDKRTTRGIISSLEDKAVIEVVRSKGGNTGQWENRLHKFSISEEIELMIARKWVLLMNDYKTDTLAFNEEDMEDYA